MTTITLTPQLEEAIAEQARKQKTTPETVILEALQEKFTPAPVRPGTVNSLDDWERSMQAAAEQLADAGAGEQAGLRAIQEGDA